MEILQLFGVNWKLILAQLINFVIVILVLWQFAVKPLTKVMAKRNEEISEGLKNAQESREKLHAVGQEIKEKLHQTKQEAEKILTSARQLAEKHQQESLAKTRQEAQRIVDDSKKQLNQEKALMVSKAQEDISGMIVQALEKILAHKLDDKIDQKYITKTLKDLNESAKSTSQDLG